MNAVLIGLLFGIIFESIFVIGSYHPFIIGVQLVFYSGLLSGFIAGKETKEGLINGLMGSFGVPLVVVVNYIFVVMSDLSAYYTLFHNVVYYVLLIIFLLILVGTFGAFGGLIGSFIKRTLFTGSVKKSLNLKAILIGLIFGLILTLVHLPGIPVIFISGLISGFIAGGKSKIGVINGFIGSFGIEIVIVIINLIRAVVYPSTQNIFLSILALMLTYIVYLSTFGLIYGLIGAIGGYIGSYLKMRENPKKGDTGNQGYLICDKCGGYYELQSGESSKDFGNCQCGGKLRYSNSIKESDNEDANQESDYEQEVADLIGTYAEKKNSLNRTIFIVLLASFLIMVVPLIISLIFAAINRH